MYNLSVETAHTFYVGDGQWLVHNTTCDDLMLGLNGRIRGNTGQGPFKLQVPNAKHWEDLGLNSRSPDFPDQLLKYMENSKQIHFDLSDMRMIGGDDGILRGNWIDRPGSTNWELRTIWDNPALREKTIFYRYGEILKPEDVLKLR